MFQRALSFALMIAASIGGASAQVPKTPPGSPPVGPDEATATPAKPAPPLAPKPPEFYKTYSNAFVFEPANRLSNAQPQMLLMTEMSPQAMTDWAEDLRVMSRLVNDTISRVSNGDGRRAMGIRIRTLDVSPATYIEGFGVLLTADTSVPLAASGKATTTESDAPPVDAWEMARRELSQASGSVDSDAAVSTLGEIAAELDQKQREMITSGVNGGSSADRANLQNDIAELQRKMADARQKISRNPARWFASPPIAPFDPAKLRALIEAMNQTLAQATHFRHLKSEEAVWLTLNGTDDSGKPMRLNFRVFKTDLDQYGNNDATADVLQQHVSHFVY